jgi:hypothetical protein
VLGSAFRYSVGLDRELKVHPREDLPVRRAGPVVPHGVLRLDEGVHGYALFERDHLADTEADAGIVRGSTQR